MANKKISELTTRTPSLSDLILVGDPSNGFSYKCTVSALATIIETDISDGYVTLGTTQTISGAKTFSNNLTLTSVANATTDPDKFLVLNGSNIVNYRTGSEVLSDIGGQATISLTTTGTSGAATFVSNTLNIPQYQGAITLTTTGTSGAATLVGNTLNIPNYAPDLSGYVPTSRTITINGTTQDLTANRTYNVGTVTSVAASAGTGISISGSPITSSGTITITNTAPDQIVALTASTGISISGTYPNFTITNSSPSLGGTVTSVALSAPTGFAVTGSPITSSGTLALAFDTGYSLPTTASQTNWDSAYNNMIVSAAVTGTTTKTLTLTQQDAGTITASWTDDNTDAVTSVFGRTGAVVATEGDYSLTQLSDVTITTPSTGQVLKYNGTIWVNDTDANTGTVTSVALSAPTGFSVSGSPVTSSGTLALSFASGYSLPTTASQTNWDTAYTNRITSLTTTGSSGAATLISNTLNIPNYTLAGLGGISLTSLSASAPLSYNNTTGAFSISQSNTTTDGYLSATDWNTFNNKQATITLTTTGTSGAATFTSNTLNIPQYQGALTLTTTGTSGAATLVGNTLNIPQYSGGGGTVSGTTNYIAKFTSSTAVGDSRLFDDGTITFLGNGDVNATPSTGIFSGTGGTGTNIAGAELRLRGGASTGNAAGGIISFYTSDAGTAGTGVNTATEKMRLDGTGSLQVIGNITANNFIPTGSGVPVNGLYLAAANSIGFATNTTPRMRIDASGNVGIGTATIGSTLQVNGNAAIGYSASTAAPTNGLAVSGNLGVGITAPTEKTEVSGTGDIKLKVSTTSTGSGANASLTLNATTEGQWILQTGNAGAGALRFYDSNAAADRMRIFSNGNIGINTLTAGSKLQVNGNAAIGYSASTAAPTNGLSISGNTTIGTTTAAGKFTIDPDDNQVGLAITGTSLTSANAQSLIDLAQTWNTTGNPTAIKLNITNTASGANADLMELQVGGVSQFTVTKGGAIQTSAPTGGTANTWKLGTVATVSPTSPNRTIEVEVGGTIYYLHAKTTNN
jgi:hypothetical protein